MRNLLWDRRICWILSPIAGLVLGAGACIAQPYISYGGIVNAASLAPAALPNGSIARGSIFSISGRNFGPAQPAATVSFPLATTLAGLSVSVCQSGNCIPAVPLFVSSGQVYAVLPSNAPLGPVSIRILINGQGGYYSFATVVPSSFGIFAVNSAGFGPAAAQNSTPLSTTLNSPAASARPGQTLILYGTGLGAGLNADNVPPQAGDLPVNVEIWAGGKPVTTKRYSGRSPCCAGLDQIVFDLPADTPSGCYVPIQVRTNGSVVSNSVTIAVSPNGGACTDAFNPLSEMWRTGGNLGLILANRVNALLDVPGGAPEETVEFALATFRQESGGTFAFHALASLPPPGACTVHAGKGDLLEGAGLPAFRGSGSPLDAGDRLTMGGISVGKLATDSIYHFATLAGTPEGFRKWDLPTTLLDGNLTIQGPGGSNIQGFSVQIPAAPAIRWFNRDRGLIVDRARGFRIDWEGGEVEGGVVLLSGFNSAIPGNASAMFLCTAPPGAKSFQVPAHIVQALPPSPESGYWGTGFDYAMVGVVPLGAGRSISAGGLRTGAAFPVSWSARAVRYQ